MEPSKTTNSFRKNDQLRRDIIKGTSFHDDRPHTEDIRNVPPLLSQGSQPLLQHQTSSLTTERNMKFHLDQLEDKLEELFASVRGAREQCRELLGQTTLMKNNLVYEELYGMKSELDGKIHGLSNQIRNGKDVAMDRYNQVRKACGELWQSTEQIRENVFQLNMRVEKLELKMGYKDIYRMQNI